jgi:hypothetical protein
LDVAHAEDVTAALLGASEWQAEAFRSAVFSYLLRWWCTAREAIAAVWDGGAWREMTAEFADEQLDLADRLTGEGGTPHAPPSPAPVRSPGAVSSVSQTDGGVQEGPFSP